MQGPEYHRFYEIPPSNTTDYIKSFMNADLENHQDLWPSKPQV